MSTECTLHNVMVFVLFRFSVSKFCAIRSLHEFWSHGSKFLAHFHDLLAKVFVFLIAFLLFIFPVF